MSINLGANLIPLTGVYGHLQLIRGWIEYEVQMPTELFNYAIWGYWDVGSHNRPFQVPLGVSVANPDQYAEIDIKFGQNLGPNISEDGVWSVFGQARDQIAQYRIPYDITFNSNSYANTLLNIVGVEAADIVVAPNLVTGGYGLPAFPGIEKDAADQWYVKYDIYGDAGANVLIGGDWKDTFQGMEGVDFIQGGSGYDYLYANSKTQFHDGSGDYLSGGGGWDTFYVGAEVDLSAEKIFEYVNGNYAFNNAVIGTFDVIRDFAPFDKINVALHDTQYGLGFSTANFTYSLANPTIINGLTGYEVTHSGSGLIGAVENTYYDPNLKETITALIFYELESYIPVFALEQSLTATVLSTQLTTSFYIGTSNDDVVIGTVLDQEFQGLGGNDTFDGAGGDDVFYASDGDGEDIYIGGDGKDALVFEVTENLSVDVSAGSVTGATTAETDTFSGIEVFQGGSGDDTFVDADIAQFYDGGSGVDTLAFERAADDYRIYASGDGYAAQRSYLGGDVVFENRWLRFEGIEQISFAGASANLAQTVVQVLEGTSAGEIITGTAANEDIFGGDGDDTLNGGGGNDILGGGAGADSLMGGDGNDRIYIDDADTWWSGGAGTDTVIHAGSTGKQYALSQGGFENAEFGSGDDTIWGTADANRIDGGAGNDVLHGYGGNDILIGGDGADSLMGGDGDDIVIIDDADTWWSGDAGIDTVVYNGAVGLQYALAQGGFENAEFGSGDDTIWGTADANIINGGAGNDVLQGNGGNDILIGGAGADSLMGGDGDDRIVIDDADTWWSGGAGNDTVVHGGATGLSYSLAQGGFENAELGVGNDTIWGTDDNNVILGGDGDDTLYGGLGDDTLDGQNGANDQVNYDGASTDYLFTRNADGSVTVTNATYGTDTLINIEKIWFSGAGQLVDLDTLAPWQNAYVGTGHSKQFTGTAATDLIAFTGGTGNQVDGGGGDDLIVFSGDVANYTILGQGSDFVIAAGNENIQFTNVEYVRFGDTDAISLADIIANSTHSPGDTWFDPEPIGGLI